MNLTTAQLQTMKSDILANPDLNGKPNTPDGAQAIADLYNLNSAPAFTVWKTNVGITEVGDKFNGAELAGLTTANQTRLQTIAMYSAAGVNPSLPDRRQFFDDVFSGAGGNITRPALLALWKRLAWRGEKLYATGTGSDAVPATLSLTAFGAVSMQNVQDARALP